MTRFALEIKSRQETVDADPEMPLLWALRDLLNMTGTKYGCGIGLCGACTVHIDGAATRSCQTTLSSAAASELSLSKVLPQTVCIWSKKPGSLNRSHNAATANPDRLYPPPRCSLRTLAPPTPISTKPWPEISAVAPPTSEFAVLSIAPQGRPTREHQTEPCAGKRQRRQNPRHRQTRRHCPRHLHGWRLRPPLRRAF